jgi:hypothetical protein
MFILSATDLRDKFKDLQHSCFMAEIRVNVHSFDTDEVAHHELDSCENKLFRVTEIDTGLKAGRY